MDLLLQNPSTTTTLSPFIHCRAITFSKFINIFQLSLFVLILMNATELDKNWDDNPSNPNRQPLPVVTATLLLLMLLLLSANLKGRSGYSGWLEISYFGVNVHPLEYLWIWGPSIRWLSPTMIRSTRSRRVCLLILHLLSSSSLNEIYKECFVEPKGLLVAVERVGGHTLSSGYLSSIHRQIHNSTRDV